MVYLDYDPFDIYVEPLDDEDFIDEFLEGKCDFCGTTFVLSYRTDHCAECGNCWTHCTCNPKRTIDDEFVIIY